ncbi:hypothetical protein MYU51_021065 [Penicillium brevicompactum]
MLLNIILYALLGTSFVLGVVELGLSAFVVSAFDNTTQEYDTWGGYVNVKVKAPAIVDFIVFSSLWTMLITVAALVVPWFYTRKGSVTPKLNTVLAASFVATYFVTMVFWLAAFADLATYLDYVSNDYYNAMIAFAVLLWLLFVALLVFTILAMCGVMASNWAGYQPVRKNKSNAPTEPVNDLSMSTPLVTPMIPSKFVYHNANVNDQPSNQSPSLSVSVSHRRCNAQRRDLIVNLRPAQLPRLILVPT